jgi:hypothetical protein
LKSEYEVQGLSKIKPPRLLPIYLTSLFGLSVWEWEHFRPIARAGVVEHLFGDFWHVIDRLFRVRLPDEDGDR